MGPFPVCQSCLLESFKLQKQYFIWIWLHRCQISKMIIIWRGNGSNLSLLVFQRCILLGKCFGLQKTLLILSLTGTTTSFKEGEKIKKKMFCPAFSLYPKLLKPGCKAFAAVKFYGYFIGEVFTMLLIRSSKQGIISPVYFILLGHLLQCS